MLTTSSLVTAATLARVGAGCAGLLAERTPPLMALAVRASIPGTETAASEAEFRDELLALARDSAERSWRELRRGLDSLDALTRPDVRGDGRARRPYRVKP